MQPKNKNLQKNKQILQQGVLIPDPCLLRSRSCLVRSYNANDCTAIRLI